MPRRVSTELKNLNRQMRLEFRVLPSPGIGWCARLTVLPTDPHDAARGRNAAPTSRCKASSGSYVSARTPSAVTMKMAQHRADKLPITTDAWPIGRWLADLHARF